MVEAWRHTVPMENQPYAAGNKFPIRKPSHSSSDHFFWQFEHFSIRK